MPILLVTEENGKRVSLPMCRPRSHRDAVHSTTADYRDWFGRIKVSAILVDSRSGDPQILDVCEDIRAISRQPLMLLTHEQSESFLMSAYAVGVDECIVRPIGSALLEAKVNAWLRWSWIAGRNYFTAGHIAAQMARCSYIETLVRNGARRRR